MSHDSLLTDEERGMLMALIVILVVVGALCLYWSEA